MVEELRVLQAPLGRHAMEERLHFLLSKNASSSREARSVADVSVVHDSGLSFESLLGLLLLPLPFLTLGASSAHTSGWLLRQRLPLRFRTDAWVFAFPLQLRLWQSLVSFVHDALQLVRSPSHVSHILQPRRRGPKALLLPPSLRQDLFDFERNLSLLSSLLPEMLLQLQLPQELLRF